MIYLDNIIFSLQKHGGVSVLWGNLINRLLDENVETKFLEYINSELNKVRIGIQIPASDIIRNHNWIPLERYKDVKIKDRDPAILHSSHYRVSTKPNIKNITTVHDFTYEFFFKGLAKSVHCWQKYRAILNSDVIICISENTKKDLLHFLPEVSKDKIRVVYNGVSDNYKPLNHRLNNYEEDFLFVGGRQSYKNFPFAIACAKSAGKRLLVVGGELTSDEQILLNKELGIDGYNLIVHPSDEELNIIYNSVNCLIYPSLYEGFGIPIIEAQKAGCPVIAMNSSSVPEIIGDKSLLMNSSDIAQFNKIYENIQFNRRDIVDQGYKNSERFSWNNMTSEYLDIYKEFKLV